METNSYGKRALIIVCVLLAVGWVCGCATPYSSSATPKASASISDTATSASLELGAVGEFTFICTHSKTTDGATTGTVHIVGSKNTVGMLGSGIIGAAVGLVTGGALK